MEHSQILSLLPALLSATFSGSSTLDWGNKVTIRPLTIKGQLMFQVTHFKENKALHRNLTSEGTAEVIIELLSVFKQSVLFTTEADYHLSHGPNGLSCRRRKPTKAPNKPSHDRTKLHLLPEGRPDPYLIELGLMSTDGRIIASKTHKYRQINHFLELVDQWLGDIPNGPLHIVDLGCGKAYLTFALYHYLRESKHLDVRLTGVDLKNDVIQDCQTLADKLGYDQLKFIQGTIDAYVPEQSVDIVVSLHACNTATDHALAKGVEWKAKFLFAAPCCQHELYGQVNCSPLTTLLQHGIMKERFAALVTDAVRAELLEAVGYDTQVIEFIDLEHSPKNLLLRSRLKPSKPKQEQAWKQYLQIKEALQITPTLEKLLCTSLSGLRDPL